MQVRFPLHLVQWMKYKQSISSLTKQIIGIYTGSHVHYEIYHKVLVSKQQKHFLLELSRSGALHKSQKAEIDFPFSELKDTICVFVSSQSIPIFLGLQYQLPSSEENTGRWTPSISSYSDTDFSSASHFLSKLCHCGYNLSAWIIQYNFSSLCFYTNNFKIFGSCISHSLCYLTFSGIQCQHFRLQVFCLPQKNCQRACALVWNKATQLSRVDCRHQSGPRTVFLFFKDFEKVQGCTLTLSKNRK